ncbi:Leucine Rich Repeat domain protein [Verrucomicrobiia bacterium DG1235]|nr:Leucine Rich Repeat domain protein [Verrucomicrobiae bacterium DG1235]
MPSISFPKLRHAFLALLASLWISSNTSALEVTFPDATLEAVVRETLNINEGPITDSMLVTLSSINYDRYNDTDYGPKIANLEGLQYATTLGTLNLFGNDISDLSPIQNLSNLKTLNLGKNPNIDFDTFPHLPNLNQLLLGFNKISNVDFLYSYPNLEYLDLISNNITTPPNVSNFPKLETLSLSDNQIADASLLSNSDSLKSLSLTLNQISILSQLHSLPKLTFLSLQRNPLSNPTGSLNLPSITQLDLQYTELESLAPYSNLTNLITLYATNNHLQSIDLLTNFPNLQYAALSGNHISSLPDLSSLDQLHTLYLDNNFIDLDSDAAAISLLEGSLSSFSIDNQKIANLSILYKVPLLTYPSQTTRVATIGSNTYWSAQTDADWLTLDPEFGYISADLNATATENLTGDRRSAMITINEQSFEVSQDPYTELELDPALEALLRAAIVKPTGVLAASDLSSLSNLTSHLYDPEESQQIKSLEGLEYAQNLSELQLTGHAVTDFSPISLLTNLTTLTIQSNPTFDPAPLASLTNLKNLTIEDSELTSLAFASSLQKLERLSAGNNAISNLSGLETLTKLQSLQVPNNLIENIDPLSNLSILSQLSIETNKVSELAPLTGLDALTDLSIGENPIQSIAPIQSLNQLQILSAHSITGIDFSPISNLTNLAYLSIRYNEIEDIHFLSGLTSLTRLEIDNNRILDPSPLATLTSLSYLQIYANHITDISSLEAITPTYGIDLHHNFIDFSADAPSVATIALWRDTLGIDVGNLDQYTASFFPSSSTSVYQEEATTGALHLEANTYWTAQSDSDWLRLTPTSGWKTTDITLLIAANGTNQDRTATLSFGDSEFTITQGFNSAYFTYLETLGIDTTDTTYWPLADKDGDKDSNLFEYETGLDLTDANSYFEYTLSVDPSDSTKQILTISKRPDGSDFPLESSPDLESWTPYTPSSEQSSESRRHLSVPATSFFLRAKLGTQ